MAQKCVERNVRKVSDDLSPHCVCGGWGGGGGGGIRHLRISGKNIYRYIHVKRSETDVVFINDF